MAITSEVRPLVSAPNTRGIGGRRTAGHPATEVIDRAGH
jgi:hypothetical protein